MDALLSIHPKYVDMIRTGDKKFEYRKTRFKRANVKKVLVYETSPVSEVVGEFIIKDIIEESPIELWEKTKKFSGISKEFFDSYFENKEMAVAIGFDCFYEYEKPVPLSEYGLKAAPQSFVYVD